jgi:hypothetical protein
MDTSNLYILNRACLSLVQYFNANAAECNAIFSTGKISNNTVE